MLTANPIIQRELVGLLRLKRALVIQVALIVALAAMVVLVWPANAMNNLEGQQAARLLATFAYGLLVGLMLLAPVYPATAIVRERQQRTLVLLLTSRLSPVAILAGKISAALGFILLLIVLSLPAAAACYAMGGFRFTTDILPLYGILALCAAQYAMIGLLVSSFAKTSDSAMRVSYGIVLALGVLVLIPRYLMQGHGSGIAGMMGSVGMLFAAAIGLAMIGVAVRLIVAAFSEGARHGIAMLLALLALADLSVGIWGRLGVDLSGGWQTVVVVIEMLLALDLFYFSFSRWEKCKYPFVFLIVLLVLMLTLTATDMLAFFSPVPAIMELLGHAQVGSRGIIMNFRSAVLIYTATAVMTILVCVSCLAFRLRPQLLDETKPRGQVTDELEGRQRLVRRLMYIIDPQRRSELIGARYRPMLIAFLATAAAGAATAYVAIREQYVLAMIVGFVAVMCLVFFSNVLLFISPVVVKEFRTRTFGRSHWMMRLIGGCLIISLGLMLIAARGSIFINLEYLGGVLVLFQMGLVVLVTPALASGVISGEVESGGWELLRMTPISAFRIVTGKLFSVAWTLLLLLVATLPGYVVLLAIDEGYAGRVLRVLATLAMTAVLAMLVAAACSSIFRRTAAATTAAYIVLLALCVGTLLPWLGQDMIFGPRIVEMFLVVNPVAAALSIIKMPGLEQYQLVPDAWRLIGIGCLVALLVLWVRTWRLSRPE